MKKTFTILTICLFLASVAHAQIFITEDEMDNPRSGTETPFGYIPEQWTTNDQANDYAPLGEGIVLFAALGSAYWLAKKRHQK